MRNGNFHVNGSGVDSIDTLKMAACKDGRGNMAQCFPQTFPSHDFIDVMLYSSIIDGCIYFVNCVLFAIGPILPIKELGSAHRFERECLWLFIRTNI